MIHRSWRLLALVALLALPSSAVAQTARNYPELPNFQPVNEHIYRGGQPKKGGIERLASLGIRTVLNLRGEGSKSRAEEARAREAGLRYYNVQFPPWGRSSTEQVEQALAVLNDPENWPVFVHCKRGSDRTGTVIACYRIATEGWNSEEATREAKQHGMTWVQYWMKDFISDFYHANRASQSTPDSIGLAKTVSYAVEEADERIGRGLAAVGVAAIKSRFALQRFFRRLAPGSQ